MPIAYLNFNAILKKTLYIWFPISLPLSLPGLIVYFFQSGNGKEWNPKMIIFLQFISQIVSDLNALNQNRLRKTDLILGKKGKNTSLQQHILFA